MNRDVHFISNCCFCYNNSIMKKLLFIPFVLMLFISCEKENNNVKVEYRLTKAHNVLDIQFKALEESLIDQTIDFSSREDWTYTYESKAGNILFLSARCTAKDSLAVLQILIDGKIYKEKTGINEPGKYEIVSGTIPF